ncbi:hypothetical protein Q7P37_003281 [Cladosporium fusiforme]
MPPKPQKRLDCKEYRVGWICPLEIEFSAARFLLDEEHQNPNIPQNDDNQYACGQINGREDPDVVYNVVIGCFPSGYQGTVAAGALALAMSHSFPNLQMNLLVGIGGGVPSPKDIRLGDVVISEPTATHGGLIQYDLGKETVSGFQRKGFLLPPPVSWLAAIVRMKSDHRAHGSRVAELLNQMFERYPRLRRSYGRPKYDILFDSEYDHPAGLSNCANCDRQYVVDDREPRDYPDEPEIHYGLIASGNKVIKNARLRDEIHIEEGGVDCFEMEAAGVATNTSSFRCIVIRGISDYADSHKNDEWHGYAAAAAAALAKELLGYMRLSQSDPDDTVPSTVYEGLDVSGDARVQHGNNYRSLPQREGQTVYRNVKTGGNAVHHAGNNYGYESVPVYNTPSARVPRASAQPDAELDAHSRFNPRWSG